MQNEPQFELTERARRWLAVNPGPLPAEREHQPRKRYGVITVIPTNQERS